MEHIETSESLLSEIQKVKKAAIREGTLREEKPLDPIMPQEIPYQLPNGWTWVRLGDYALKVTDYVASGSFASLKENVLITNEPNYAIMVKTADFANDFTKGLTYTDKHGYEFLSNSNLYGGELILSNIGSIGKVFIVPYLDQPMTLASNTVMVKVTNDELIKYLYYYFLSPLGQRTLRSISSGTSMMKFNKTQLKNTLIPVAPLFEQKHIVSLMERTEAMIDHLQQQLQTLDTLIKARFVEMFGDPETNSRKWDCIKLGEICDLQNGYAFKSDDYLDHSSIFNCRMSNIRPGGVFDADYHPKFLPEAYWDIYQSYRLVDGDIIIAMTDMASDPKILGVPTIVKSNGHKFLLNQRVGKLMFRDVDRMNNTYVMFFLGQDYIRKSLAKSAGGSTQINVGKPAILNITILEPPRQLQDQFSAFVSQVDKSKVDVQTALEKVQMLFDSLMQQYFG